MTSAGGVSNAGTVFEISTQGVLNTLVNFTGANGPPPGGFGLEHGRFFSMARLLVAAAMILARCLS